MDSALYAKPSRLCLSSKNTRPCPGFLNLMTEVPSGPFFFSIPQLSSREILLPTSSFRTRYLFAIGHWGSFSCFSDSCLAFQGVAQDMSDSHDRNKQKSKTRRLNQDDPTARPKMVIGLRGCVICLERFRKTVPVAWKDYRY